MAYVLVVTLIGIITQDLQQSYWMIGGTLLMQLCIGALMGLALGRVAVRIINRIKIGNDSLYPILIFTFSIFIFSFTYVAKGNGFLAVYIAGLVLGNSKFVHKRSSLNFFDGLAWMSQLIMFLTLGLLVNPHELVPIIVPGLIISFLMIFVTRPLTVFFCLLPFRKMPIRDKAYISWVGLRGAVPIIFAIIPLVEGVPHARLIFNIVFLCTLVSLIVQGTSLPLFARWLNLVEKPREVRKVKNFDIDFSNDIKSITSELVITDTILKKGNQLMNLPFPENTIAVLVNRDEHFFVPTGTTILQERDKVLIITDNHDALMETYKNLGIENT